MCSEGLRDLEWERDETSHQYPRLSSRLSIACPCTHRWRHLFTRTKIPTSPTSRVNSRDDLTTNQPSYPYYPTSPCFLRLPIPSFDSTADIAVSPKRSTPTPPSVLQSSTRIQNIQARIFERKPILPLAFTPAFKRALPLAQFWPQINPSHRHWAHHLNQRSLA